MSSPGPPKKFKRKCAAGKTCDNCGADNTPNWRRGWPLADGGHANLCNACGIRYKPGKDRKGGGLLVRPPFVPPPKQGPTKGMWTTPVKALTPAPGLPEALPEEVTRPTAPRGARRASASGAARRRSGSARRRRRVYSSDESDGGGSEDGARSEEEEAEAAQDEDEEGGSAGEDPATLPLFARQRFALAPPDMPAARKPAARKRSGGVRKKTQHVTHAEDRPVAAAQPPPPPSPYVGFFRSTCASLEPDKHEMYFVRARNGGFQLAAVGVDIYGTGHFRYTAAPGFAAARPLGTCTRREDLAAWLASVGAEKDLGFDDGSAAAVATSVPAPAAAPSAAASSTMEAAAANAAVAVAAPPGGWASWREENALQHGRRMRSFYLVTASGSKTLAVLGAEAGGRPGGFQYTPALPLPSSVGGVQLPLPLPGRAEVISFLRAAVRASGGPMDGGVVEAHGAAAGAAPASAAGAAFAVAMGANATDSGMRRRQAPERYDPRPPAPAPTPKLRTPPIAAGGSYSGGYAPAAAFGSGSGGGGYFASFCAPPGGGYAAPMPYGGYMTGSFPGRHPPPFPQRGMDTPLSARHVGIAAPPMPLPMFSFGAPAERVDAAELAAKVGPTASRWALQTPTAAQVAQFKAWAAELERGVLPPDAPAEATAAAIISDPDAPPAPVTEARALELLTLLDRSEISLELLEASQIGRSVALLRTQQASAAVAAAADRIARSWRATADAIICAVGSPMAVGGATPA